MKTLFDLARPFFNNLDPERGHELAIRALAAGVHPRQFAADPGILKTSVLGLDFANPVGMAPGFDKNGEVTGALLAIGFGFVEAGTVTPRPQEGNPGPRLFRLAADRAVINRLGFNNDGHAAVLARLQKRRRRKGIIGVNVGANRDAQDRVADYVAGIRAFAGVADYLTVNVSSPNTAGLRALQGRDALGGLLEKAIAARDEAAADGPRRPVLLKIAPDLTADGLKGAVEVAMTRGIDGIIVSNTTVARPMLKDREQAMETGGLSGRPLFAPSTRCLARVYRMTKGELPLIGVGGIDSGETAYAKIKAGASLVQLYTGLIFEGVGLVGRIKRDLARLAEKDGHKSVAAAVGTDTARWTED